jgi:hypothetical protein
MRRIPRPQRPPLRPVSFRRPPFLIRDLGDPVLLGRPFRDGNVAWTTLKPVKNVVGMQHPPITFARRAVTPKKAADACLFCFTADMPRSKL